MLEVECKTSQIVKLLYWKITIYTRGIIKILHTRLELYRMQSYKDVLRTATQSMVPLLFMGGKMLDYQPMLVQQQTSTGACRQPASNLAHYLRQHVLVAPCYLHDFMGRPASSQLALQLNLAVNVFHKV